MKPRKKHRQIVFCDFDGTITTEETFVGMVKTFASAPYAEVKQLIIDGQITLGEGVRRMVESIPSKKYPDILDYILSRRIREGFAELLDDLSSRDVPFVVISGGLQETVSARLAEYQGQIHGIHAAKVVFKNGFLSVSSAFESDVQLVDKTQAMALYDYEAAVMIGDGITDTDMGMSADLVFARDYLARYLAERNKPFIRWKDFFDVREHLIRCRR